MNRLTYYDGYTKVLLPTLGFTVSPKDSLARWNESF